MSQDNKAIVRRYFEEAWAQGKLDVLDEILAPGFTLTQPPIGGYTGIAAAKKDLEISNFGYSNIRVNIDGIIAEGDVVAAWFTFTGTHTAEILGVPATGKKITSSGVAWFHLAGGKIIDSFWGLDALGTLQEFGLVPPIEQILNFKEFPLNG